MSIQYYLSSNFVEELNLSESSEEREHFLSEVYHLQQESGHVDDKEEQMMDKEIEGFCCWKYPLLCLNSGFVFGKWHKFPIQLFEVITVPLVVIHDHDSFVKSVIILPAKVFVFSIKCHPHLTVHIKFDHKCYLECVGDAWVQPIVLVSKVIQSNCLWLKQLHMPTGI